MNHQFFLLEQALEDFQDEEDQQFVQDPELGSLLVGKNCLSGRYLFKAMDIRLLTWLNLKNTKQRLKAIEKQYPSIKSVLAKYIYRVCQQLDQYPDLKKLTKEEIINKMQLQEIELPSDNIFCRLIYSMNHITRLETFVCEIMLDKSFVVRYEE